ncbi:class I SAM-dependent methyltransferase [Candidatus Woesearchaeota archaeon]|jgi:SAM-dependent methyltransferase|nr:class I SAM-dependent methyltransferase [Candidatus Woesearchaeota archaeon]MBT4367970.1 class I SAM-dependent methyltransferase [Candidatus Woesearchaeota archaeon]MBT4712458.1 class I SAM-dependent methyltransferase [Candidatus Woesearchaeota archaeon]MBT6639371.1 class I SAM-dependent methyltransferase [Candidatus Woesearchaeota archaeon]MBT7133543.1 class I SAM-dependent methyltransferase [Candidatus Woesearchaeota archaeon]
MNAFGKTRPEIKEILTDSEVSTYINNTLITVLKTLDIENPKAIVTQLLTLAKKPKLEYEESAHDLLTERGVTKQRIAEKLSGRADLIVRQIKPYLKGTSVLDFGCGDGKVGHILSKEGYNVTLTDIYEHDHIKDTNLPFQIFKQGEQVTLDQTYDNILLLTVLHHSDDPVKTLRDARRLLNPNGHLIVIESVYGIEAKKGTQTETEFTHLSSEQQRRANIIFDHFYNRIIHFRRANKVNVPFNFNTPEEWNNLAKKESLEEITTKTLGIDQPTVPEYHTLHVWRC